MKRFLIVGNREDRHAHYVSWALETAGYRVTFTNSSHDNCPTRTTLYLDNDSDEFTSPDWNNAEAAWCRRIPWHFTLDDRDGEDAGYIREQEVQFARWLVEMENESRSIRWINPPAAALAAENKFIQLKTARSHGIGVPRTLITAEPRRFRAFLRREGVIVAKPLCPYSWEYASGVKLEAFANVVDAKRGSELSDEDIAQCVTMYQQRIDKVSDVRMVIMGRDIFAYKITQEGEQHLDFRIGFYQPNHFKFEEISVPVALKKKIIAFMGSMRINFASADFALTADGEFVFLDLNPSGQWLFIAEGSEPRVGQKFCSFFVDGRVDPDRENVFPSYSEFTETDVAKSMEEAFRQHSAAQARSLEWKER
jgi:hypothetical protein